MSRPVLPEGEARFRPPVQAPFQELSHDKCFKQSFERGMRFDLGRRFDSQEPGDEPGVGKVKLWSLEHILVEVPVMGKEEEQETAGLQEGKPGFCRIVRDLADVGEGGRWTGCPVRPAQTLTNL